MKQLSLREIQDVSCDILKVVHEFCIENKIQYSLAYGTLLGAVRHHGFIPWDDDIDIIMPRPDYLRFCKSFHASGYQVFSHETTPDCIIGYARVCDMERTIVYGSTWTQKRTGLWVDIFPIDGAENNRNDFEQRCLKVKKIFADMQVHRNANKKLSLDYPLT